MEVDTLEHTIALVRAGADILQFDKLPSDILTE